MLIRVFCVAEQASSRGVLEGGGATGLLNKGGGSNRLPVEFPQVQTSNYEYSHLHSHSPVSMHGSSITVCPDG